MAVPKPGPSASGPTPELSAEADQCIRDVLRGEARADRSAYPPVVIGSDDVPFRPRELMERYLATLPDGDFPYDEAVQFCDALRKLSRWAEIETPLEEFAKASIRVDDSGAEPDESLLRFACHVAVCFTVYGESFSVVTTDRLLALVSRFRPDMVKELKKNGTGRLPADLQNHTSSLITATANDAFGEVRINLKGTSREHYAEALNHLCRLLEHPQFPQSYSVAVRGGEKTVLPIAGLPKKPIHHLIAGAAQWELHAELERYARLAMREYAEYTNFGDELVVLPGSFAVFALGMTDEQWWPLVNDYFALCDDEHSSVQQKFLHAFIKKFGFTALTVPIFIRGVVSTEDFRAAKEFPELVANPASLDALIAVKAHVEDLVSADDLDDFDDEDADLGHWVWHEMITPAIWGTAAKKHGAKVLASAPEDLIDRYQQVFA
ncbi:DUF6138 family protein [Enemella sp. A6]|uniref:DUF6138 family protein n=1 Tax=Enemella sp. A6 TaxID=3440152 RepID=UPI003EB8A92C